MKNLNLNAISVDIELINQVFNETYNFKSVEIRNGMLLAVGYDGRDRLLRGINAKQFGMIIDQWQTNLKIAV